MIDSAEIKKIAELARLELAESEMEKLQNNFTQIKMYFSKLSEIDVNEIHDENVDDKRDIMRDDEVKTNNIHISEFSKFEDNNAFIVPKVIE
mgnify:CR=1 FL=1